MGVISLSTKQSLIDLQEKGDKFVILFWAAWHEPSKKGGQMQGIQFALSDKFPSITFCSVEAEEVPEISELLSISVVPTFVAFHGKTLIGKVEGVQPAEVSSLVKKLNELSSSHVVNGKEKEVVDLNTKLERLINLAPVMLFMKGSPAEPKCGFSRQIVEILKSNEIPFATFDILTDDEVRSGLKLFSDWPTYPQLYVKGVLIGGLDIIKEMQQEGALKAQFGI